MHTPITVLGTLRPDGTLELDEKPSLPPGRVRVTVQPVPEAAKESLTAVMNRIWEAQKSRGHVPRTREQIDAELDALRQEAEEEVGARERLHEEGRPAREQPPEPAG